MALLCVVVLPSVAGAHGERVSTRPEDGAVVRRPPDHVRINLTETPSERTSVVVLDGCEVDLVDEVFTTQKTLHVLLDRGQPGEWSVDYKVVSKEDGHKTGDIFTFTVEGEADCREEEEKDPTDPDDTVAPDTGPDTGDASGPVADDSSLPIVPLILGSVVLLGLAFAIRSVSSKN